MLSIKVHVSQRCRPGSRNRPSRRVPMAERNGQRPYEYELVSQNTNNSNISSGGIITTENSSNRNSQEQQRTSRVYVMESGSKARQYIATGTGNLIAFSAGCVLTWTSPCLTKLYDNWETESPLDRKITLTEKSWISSILPLAAAFGPIIAGYLADRIGRKIVLLGAAIPFIVGWILMATTNTVVQILIARFLWGLSVGAVFTVLPMYVGEIADDDVRGALGSFMQLFITFGILWAYAVGAYTSFKVFSYLSVTIPIAFLIFFFFMPESPYYLLGKNNRSAATEALMFLRGKSNDGVQKELEQMQCNVDETKKQSGTIKDLFATASSRKAMLLSCGLVGFQQFSGINAVLFFCGMIFSESGSTVAPEINAIIIGCVQIGSSAVTPLVVDRLGRRMLLLISGVGMACGLFILGGCFNAKDRWDVELDGFLAQLPVISLVLYMVVYCIGFGPLPWAVMGELFSANIKSLASTATASFCWILGFFITQYFEQVSTALGKDTSFWFFAACCVLATAFVFTLLPETKGKSLEEIQAMLAGNTKK